MRMQGESGDVIVTHGETSGCFNFRLWDVGGCFLTEDPVVSWDIHTLYGVNTELART